MTINRTVTVFGAYGHTGVVSELLARRWNPILAGRDVDKLTKLGDEYHCLKVRAASVDSVASLGVSLLSVYSPVSVSSIAICWNPDGNHTL